MKLNARQKKLVQEAEAVLRQIEKLKKKYARIDEIVELLIDSGIKTGKLSEKLTLVDSFEDKNTAFKSAFFKRFDLVLEKPKKRK